MTFVKVSFTQYEKENIMRDFPNVKLSYENIIYKKVYNADSYVAIPEGLKCFAWFTNYNNRNVCFIMELSEKKQIKNIKIANVCFSSSLSYGTILYGTIFKHPLHNHFFTVEDIFQCKGRMIERENWGNKYILFNELFKNDIKQVAYNNSFTVFGLPIIANSIDTLTQKLENVKYKIDSIQFRSFYRSNNYLFVSYKIFMESNTHYNAPNNNVSNDNVVNKEKPLVKNEPKREIRDNNSRKEIIFIIKPDIQNDIYHLYCNNNMNKEEYYGFACIPDYKCSVMMNQLFRTIKENQNLDALEESDDEEEFQDEREDRFVYLERSYKMICRFNYKFKKWYPVKIADESSHIVTQKELLFYK